VQGQHATGRGRRPRHRGGVEEEVCWEDHVANGKEGKKQPVHNITSDNFFGNLKATAGESKGELVVYAKKLFLLEDFVV
jgi:hypothetical protein